jgi:hypothetical protein
MDLPRKNSADRVGEKRWRRSSILCSKRRWAFRVYADDGKQIAKDEERKSLVVKRRFVEIYSFRPIETAPFR